MDFLKVLTSSKETIQQSFDRISKKLFTDFKLQVNNSFYRLIDIEFYFFADGIYEDVHTHQNEVQLNSGKWYFHQSGIDLTIGNGTHYGGILFRGLAKFSKDQHSNNDIIERDIHGPLKVKMEICSNLYGAFDKCNIFRLNEVHGEGQEVLMKSPIHTIKTARIGLTPKIKDTNNEFLNGEYRYQILLNDFKLNYKNKEAIVKSLLADKKIDKAQAKEILGYNVTTQ
jgi:hypothetical protein